MYMLLMLSVNMFRSGLAGSASDSALGSHNPEPTVSSMIVVSNTAFKLHIRTELGQPDSKYLSV